MKYKNNKEVEEKYINNRIIKNMRVATVQQIQNQNQIKYNNKKKIKKTKK